MGVSYDITGTLMAQIGGHPPLVFDARGNGGGAVCPTITGDHQDRITDYTAIVIQKTATEITGRQNKATASEPLAPR